MGVNRCGWVWWGAGAREGTKPTEAETKMAVQGVVLALWPGEISPDMMFWEGFQKMVNMVADGQISVRTGAVGLVGMRGTQNSKKKFENACKWEHLATHDHCTKTRITLGWPKKRTARAISIISGG